MPDREERQTKRAAPYPQIYASRVEFFAIRDCVRTLSFTTVVVSFSDGTIQDCPQTIHKNSKSTLFLIYIIFK